MKKPLHDQKNLPFPSDLALKKRFAPAEANALPGRIAVDSLNKIFTWSGEGTKMKNES